MKLLINIFVDFFKIAEQGNSLMLKILLKHFPDARMIQVKNLKGRSALHIATYYNQIECVKLLVEAGADLNQRERTYQQNCLHIACNRGFVELVEYFLAKGMDVNEVDVDGYTPLHIAVYSKKYEIVKLLLEKGADKTKKMENGKTPKQLAMRLNAPKSIIDLL